MAIMAMIGVLAEHGMNVVVMIVMRRSLSFSIVREAIIPGTPQPVPMSMGINDFPERPNLRKIRSRMNATRDMYPQPSRKARKKNSTMICGTKPRTAPTPPTIPSTSKLWSQGAALALSRPKSHSAGILGTQTPKSDSCGAFSRAGSTTLEMS